MSKNPASKTRCPDCNHQFIYHHWGICGVTNCRVWLMYPDSRCPAMFFQDEATSKDLGILIEKAAVETRKVTR